jgi:hypothetical protein
VGVQSHFASEGLEPARSGILASRERVDREPVCNLGARSVKICVNVACVCNISDLKRAN